MSFFGSRLLICIFTFVCIPLNVMLGIDQSENSQKIESIDLQIKDLQERKRGYLGTALRHENYAENQQFEDRVYLESRRHLELAEEYKQKADDVQKQIDLLEQQKAELLKDNR